VEMTSQSKAEELIAQHLSVMLVLGGFSYAERIEYVKRSASITARTVLNNKAENADYWAEVQKFIENYKIH